jgi:hypothetical protein
MTLRSVAALGALALLPWLAAGATSAAPTPRPSTSPGAPCGYVDFIPVTRALYQNGTAYERIKAIVSFPDEHKETAEFPYPWVYENGEQTDPWSYTNLRRRDFTVTLQQPPAGADVKAFPPLIQYVLAHTDAKGYTDLPSCPRRAPDATPLSQSTYPPSAFEESARIAAIVAAKSRTRLTFTDDTPRGAPVGIVTATLDAAEYEQADLLLTCVTFVNRAAQTATAVRFTFTYADGTGRSGAALPLDRFGAFAPGQTVEGIHRAPMASSKPDVEASKNCRLSAGNTNITPGRVAVTAVQFANHTTWPPGSPSVWSAPPR